MEPFSPITAPLVFDPLPLQVAGISLIVVVLLAYTAMMLIGRRPDRVRTHVYCPVRLRTATVTFSTGPTGERTGIVKCSIFPGRPLTCGKACLPARA